MKFGKIQSIVSEEKFFESKVYGHTEGHNTITIARWPSASGAKNKALGKKIFLRNK